MPQQISKLQQSFHHINAVRNCALYKISYQNLQIYFPVSSLPSFMEAENDAASSIPWLASIYSPQSNDTSYFGVPGLSNTGLSNTANFRIKEHNFLELGPRYNITFVCSGILLDRLTIITASKCYYQKNTEALPKVFVRFGNMNVSNAVGTVTDDEVNIHYTDVLKVRHYFSENQKSGLVFLRLKEQVPLGSNIQPLCLPAQNYSPKDKEKCFITGWDKNSTLLKWRAVKIESTDSCSSVEDSDPFLLFSSTSVSKNETICTSNPKGPCIINQGGPLICIKDGTPILVGVFTGTECPSSSKPLTFKKIEPLLGWIYPSMVIHYTRHIIALRITIQNDVS